MQDLALRAQLNGQLRWPVMRAYTEHRHQAAWRLAGIDTQLPLFAAQPVQEATPMLPVPTEGQNIRADYAALGLSLRRHPMALLRERCLRRQMLNAQQLSKASNDSTVRTAGLVLARQSPGTANNTTFITLEDETGQVNLIVWSSIAQRYRQTFLSSTLLEVSGQLQHQSGVMHVVVESMTDRSHWLGELQIKARNFH
jgi:error-prone DNA polymerase